MRSADGHVGAVELGGSDGKKTLLDKPNAAGFVHERGESRDAQLTRRENEKVAKGAISLAAGTGCGLHNLFCIWLLSINGRSAHNASGSGCRRARPTCARCRNSRFADRAGDDRTNLTLSEARAEAVRAALSGLERAGRFVLDLRPWRSRRPGRNRRRCC